jgi:lipid-binding SYLF domain-containing protein
LEVFDALDNFCSADGSVATGNGFVLHPGGLHPHSADFGHRNGVDSHHSGAKSGIANVQSQNFFEELLMFKIHLISICAILLLFVGVGMVIPAEAQQSQKQSAEADRAREASTVLTEIMSIPENSIPEELMARAHGIAVIPHVVKGAFGIGGQWGKGLMSQRHEDGNWSVPAYIEVGGGSFGLQIGVQASDIVLVFTDEDGLKGLLKGKLKLGADASATAGPVGRKAEIGTDVLLRSAVFAYSRSKGLFAGVSLDGSVVGIDDSANSKIYGKNVTGEQILLGKAVQANATVEPFLATLRKVSPPHVHIKKSTQTENTLARASE